MNSVLFTLQEPNRNIVRRPLRWLRAVLGLPAVGLLSLCVVPRAMPGEPLFAQQAEQTPARVNRIQTDAGPAVLRRLTRFEYDRTVQNLFAIDFDSRDLVGMSAEEGGQGYDNLAAALNIPPALLEKYLAAADKILDRILAGPDGRVPDMGNRDQSQKAHNALFFVKPGTDAPARDAAQQIVEAFTKRAWRRPVPARDVNALLKLYDAGEKRGEPFETCLRPVFKAILVSPYFLYRVETNRADVRPNASYPVDDYALAARLSYFLWGSMPDQALFDLAEQHKLSDPSVLEQQTRRMLADPNARALTDDFAAQWLQLRKLPNARPSTDFFPTFTPSLREAMYGETTAFFDDLRTGDKSLLKLLDADYTYVNEELANHYDLKGVKGAKLQLVKLAPEDHRGGLLGMGSVLAMTSHTYRTSPTLRGKWILDVVFGTPPPPPPPGVSTIVDEQKKQKTGTTFRDLLAQHASNPACAGCHQKMDPLGFAMENYDAVGRWRAATAKQPLDTSAQLPTGEKLNGAQELKQIILKRKDAFIRNFAEQMLIYALGRGLESTDEPTIAHIVSDLQKNDYRFSTLIVDITQSVPFRYRRNLPAAPEPAKPNNKPTVHPAANRKAVTTNAKH